MIIVTICRSNDVRRWSTVAGKGTESDVVWIHVLLSAPRDQHIRPRCQHMSYFLCRREGLSKIKTKIVAVCCSAFK